MLKYVTIAILVFMSSAAAAQAAFPAPFGLTWGASAADLGKIGFTGDKSIEGLHAMTSATAPKPWLRAGQYVALLYQDRLVKVAAISEYFIDDLGGDKGAKAYNEVKAALTAKYGEPTSHTEYIAGRLYTAYDEFYQCLNYPGCGYYGATYNYKGGAIGLQLKGESRGKGYILVQYESPEFEKDKDAIRAGQEASDSATL